MAHPYLKIRSKLALLILLTFLFEASDSQVPSIGRWLQGKLTPTRRSAAFCGVGAGRPNFHKSGRCTSGTHSRGKMTFKSSSTAQLACLGSSLPSEGPIESHKSRGLTAIGPGRPHKHKDPTNPGFWYPPSSWVLEPEFRILMFINCTILYCTIPY